MRNGPFAFRVDVDCNRPTGINMVSRVLDQPAIGTMSEAEVYVMLCRLHDEVEELKDKLRESRKKKGGE